MVSHQKEQFEDPDVFKPERWLREEKEEHKMHAFASLPFGYGVRMCLGTYVIQKYIYCHYHGENRH